jgi:hypothetical protein
MNLKSIGISNFKAFGKELQTVPIKPITLVFGPNSAGKSSLLHSLLWLNHVVHTGDCDVDSPRASLGSVHLGGFRQILHHHKTSEAVIFSIIFPLAASVPGKGNTENKPASCIELKLAYRKSVGALQKSDFNLAESRLLFDGETFLKSRAHVVTELDFKHPVLVPAIEALSTASQQDDESLQRFFSALIEKEVLTIQVVEGLPAILDHDFMQLILVCDDASPVSFKQAGQFINDVLKAINPFMNDVRNAAKDNIELTYLPPVRELPPRDFDPSKRPEAAWREIARNPDLIPRLDQWLGNDKLLGTGYRLENRAFLPTDSIRTKSPALLRQELWNLLTNTNFATDAAYLMEEAERNFRSLDKATYASAHPALYDSLIEHEIDFAKSNDDWWDPPYSELTHDERLERAKSITDDIIADGDVEGWLWDHYLENFKPLTEFLNDKWSILSATGRLASGIEAECQDRKYELSLVENSGGTRLALQDVGFGISQFLPVLIHSFGSKKQLIAIEQPEIHIHPRLQAELGDVFIESALGENKNTFLLETHSEHLILRILRRIKETSRRKLPDGCLPITPADIAVLYVEPGDEGSVVRELRVNDQGRFIDDWPNGFFEERFNEEF